MAKLEKNLRQTKKLKADISKDIDVGQSELANSSHRLTEFKKLKIETEISDISQILYSILCEGSLIIITRSIKLTFKVI